NVPKGISDRVVDQKDLVRVIEGLGKEHWDKTSDVDMGEDISTNVNVGIGGCIGMIDIGVVGIDRDVGIFGIFGDVGDVITDEVEIMGNATNAGGFSSVE
ncbi:hypothetical protein KI387_015406, partial [Taxus chinensis]